jgi:hypothetical protein
MANHPRDNGVTLLQRNPSREQLLEKMRNKLAASPGTAQAESQRRKEVRRRSAGTWAVRALALLGLCAINYLLIGNRDVIAAKLHKPAVPRLPAAAETLSPDAQALYYVYALYDYPRLREQYGVNGFLAVDQKEARRRLDELLPRVSPKTLGTISGYMPVAFRAVRTGEGQ